MTTIHHSSVLIAFFGLMLLLGFCFSFKMMILFCALGRSLVLKFTCARRIFTQCHYDRSIHSEWIVILIALFVYKDHMLQYTMRTGTSSTVYIWWLHFAYVYLPSIPYNRRKSDNLYCHYKANNTLFTFLETRRHTHSAHGFGEIVWRPMRLHLICCLWYGWHRDDNDSGRTTHTLVGLSI